MPNSVITSYSIHYTKLYDAGAIESIACILAIKNGIVPPTINHVEDDPEIDSALNYTFHKAQQREVKVAISNTFGFGGHNASVVYKAL